MLNIKNVFFAVVIIAIVFVAYKMWSTNGTEGSKGITINF